MAKITFNNKVTLSPQPSIARENKVIDDDINEIKSVVNGNDDETIGLKGTILWTNPNTSSSFAAQTLNNVDLTNYDMILILYNDAADRKTIHSTGKLPKVNGKLTALFNGAIWDRDYSFNNNLITFTNGHKYNTYTSSTTTDNNGAVIPIYIIGYKTGLFN